jgi:hypothetical protein
MGASAIGSIPKEVTMRFTILVEGDQLRQRTCWPAGNSSPKWAVHHKALMTTGISLAAEGRRPAATDACVTFPVAKRAAVDGPFAETKELLGG